MSTVTQVKMQVVGSELDVCPPLISPHPEEAAGQSYVENSIVKYDTSGDIAECADGAIEVCGVSAGLYQGSGNKTPIYQAKGLIMEMNVYHSVPGSAITNRNQIGGKYGLKLSGDNWYVDLTRTAAGEVAVVIIGLSPKDTEGDTYGRVWVKFLPNAIQGNGEDLFPNDIAFGGALTMYDNITMSTDKKVQLRGATAYLNSPSADKLQIVGTGEVEVNSGDFDLNIGAGKTFDVDIADQTTTDTAGGDATLTAGKGEGTGTGGMMQSTAGQGGATGAGGASSMTGGAGGATSGAGGAASVAGGAATTNGAGGAASLTGGAGAAANAGGAASVTGGAGGATGNGGAASLTAGAGGATSGNGGAANLTAGNATTAGTGGAANITAGDGAGTNPGGNVLIDGGTGGTGAGGNGGDIDMAGGDAGAASGGNGGNIIMAVGAKDGAGANGQILATGNMKLTGSLNWLTENAGVKNAYTATPSPAWTAYTTGQFVFMTVGVNNDAASTLNVSGLGAKSIKTASGADPAAGDLITTAVSMLVYDGTNFVLINPATTCD